jgi:L-lactate dehydrogenase complex protein LldG
MTSPRDAFLDNVRRAVAEGNRAGARPALTPRGSVGYQGAGPDPVARFRAELTAAGGHAHVVPDGAGAVKVVLELVRARGAVRVLLGEGAFVDTLPLAQALASAGVDVVRPAAASRDDLFAADVGITGVDYLVAETGSVALFSRPGEPRSLSLLPPVHVAVGERSQLLPDLFDLFDAAGGELPSCLSLITGPSKTGDIELRLVTGVHGPGEVHVVLVDHPRVTP